MFAARSASPPWRAVLLPTCHYSSETTISPGGVDNATYDVLVSNIFVEGVKSVASGTDHVEMKRGIYRAVNSVVERIKHYDSLDAKRELSTEQSASPDRTMRANASVASALFRASADLEVLARDPYLTKAQRVGVSIVQHAIHSTSQLSGSEPAAEDADCMPIIKAQHADRSVLTRAASAAGRMISRDIATAAEHQHRDLRQRFEI